MKHRLAPLLEGMEMGKSEHDWLEQRLESMTAKEELLFRGAMQIESPRDIQTTIKILQGLDHYQLLYGAEDDVLLGRFVMEHLRSSNRLLSLRHHKDIRCPAPSTYSKQKPAKRRNRGCPNERLR